MMEKKNFAPTSQLGREGGKKEAVLFGPTATNKQASTPTPISDADEEKHVRKKNERGALLGEIATIAERYSALA